MLPAGPLVVHQHSPINEQLEPSVVTPGKIEGLSPNSRIWPTHRHRGEAAGGWCGGHGPHGAQASDASSCRGSPSPGAAERDVVRAALPEVDRVAAQPAPCPPPHAYRASRRPSGASGTPSTEARAEPFCGAYTASESHPNGRPWWDASRTARASRQRSRSDQGLSGPRSSPIRP